MTTFSKEFDNNVLVFDVLGAHNARCCEVDQVKEAFKDWQPQQVLPVVPECVAKILIQYKGSNQPVYGLLKALELSKGTDIYNWIFSEGNQDIFALAFITGKYEVEKPQLFYLKNKLTTSYLALDINTGYYEHWGEEIIPKLLNKQGYKLSFTQQEINSMETGSYEQIEVAE